MNPGALVLLAAGAHLAPLHIASALGQSHAAWEYVAYAVEAAVLWLLVAACSRLVLVQAAAAWGAMEAAQRAGCRLAFPMDQKPQLLPGQNLCDAATGMPMTWVSVCAALFVACLAQEVSRAAHR